MLVNKPFIIAFSGAKGSGKTTAAEYLVNEYGFVRHSFAKPLKEMLKCIGLSDQHVYGNLKEISCPDLGGKTPREVLMWLGTDLFRNRVWKDVWVHAWKNTINSELIVVDDLRFPNEYDIVKSLSGIVIKIERPNHKKYTKKWWYKLLPFLVDGGHETESYNLPYDWTVYNDLDIDHLQKEIEEEFALSLVHSKISDKKAEKALKKWENKKINGGK